MLEHRRPVVAIFPGAALLRSGECLAIHSAVVAARLGRVFTAGVWRRAWCFSHIPYNSSSKRTPYRRRLTPALGPHMKHFLLLLLLALIVPSAQASEPSGICPNSQTQSELDDCAAKMAKSADASLQKFYATYTKRLDPQQIRLFNSANSDWARYRISYCKFESGGVLGGSAYPMIFDLCIASQSHKRLQELRELSRCSEGDLSCPARSASVPNHSFEADGFAVAQLQR